MATAVLPRTPRSSSRPTQRSRPDLTELAVFGLALAAALAFLAPLLVVALPVALVCLIGTRRGWWPAWLPVLVVGVLVGGPWALWLRAHGGWEAAVQGYVDLQQTTALRIFDGTSADLLRNYCAAVWPSAVPGGAVLGAAACFTVSLASRTTKRNGETPPTEVCAMKEDRVDWAVARVLGRGVVTLLSGPPGIGKGYWTWALLRAMQERGRFFGLTVRRPWRGGGRWRWWRSTAPQRVLWLTEEGPSFARTRRRFGIRPGLALAVQRHTVPVAPWPETVASIGRLARRYGCAYVIVDTIRAWCPEAERDPERANAVMGEVRRQWTAAGLGVLFVHHDTKAGGDHGAGVSGTYGLVGAVDILVELRRVKDRATARRMVVSRRFGDMDVTATLDEAHRYIADDAAPTSDEAHGEAPAAQPPTDVPATPALPPHLAALVDVLRRAGAAGLSTTAVQQTSGVAKATVLRHLAQLQRDGHVTKEEAGGAFVWRAVGLPSPPHTADPAYVKYLGSKAWAQKRREILDRAAGRCEECGATTPESELEVHHLTYADWGQETPEQLIALCPADHRRRHAKAS